MSALHTLFGIDLPVLQAPMAGVQTHTLAVAVSEAGGLGALPCALLSPSQLRDELQALRAATQRPFNVNFFCHTPPVPDEARERAWRQALAPYYAEFDLDPTAVPAGPGRAPFSAEAAQLLADIRPAVVSFHFGLPQEALLAPLRSWGAKIIASATTVDEARWLAARGVDAVIAQGVEAGGHRGMFLTDDVSTQVGTLALVRQITKAIDTPVIAAGGIADAAAVRAVLAAGAVAAQVGTAYLLCPEATTSAVHRAALQAETARHTALTRLFTGRPARGIVNRLMRELGPMNPAAPAFPLATAVIAPLRAAAERQGRGDFSPLWAGQDTSGCCERPAAELTRALARV